MVVLWILSFWNLHVEGVALSLHIKTRIELVYIEAMETNIFLAINGSFLTNYTH